MAVTPKRGNPALWAERIDAKIGSVVADLASLDLDAALVNELATLIRERVAPCTASASKRPLPIHRQCLRPLLHTPRVGPPGPCMEHTAGLFGWIRISKAGHWA
jgi:hypothetical protein